MLPCPAYFFFFFLKIVYFLHLSPYHCPSPTLGPGSHYIAQVGPRLIILLPLTFKWLGLQIWAITPTLSLLIQFVKSTLVSNLVPSLGLTTSGLQLTSFEQNYKMANKTKQNKNLHQSHTCFRSNENMWAHGDLVYDSPAPKYMLDRSFHLLGGQSQLDPRARGLVRLAESVSSEFKWEAVPQHRR